MEYNGSFRAQWFIHRYHKREINTVLLLDEAAVSVVVSACNY